MARRSKKGFRKKEHNLVLRIEGQAAPFKEVKLFNQLPVEYDEKNDIYKGEIKVYPSPIMLYAADLHEDGSLKLPYGTTVDLEFGAEATIRGRVLHIRNKLRIIEVGIKVGDVVYDSVPQSTRKEVDVNAVEEFAQGLTIVEG